MVQADQMMALAGVSYRQLDHWTHAGYLRVQDTSPGSGKYREWSMDELVVAQRIRQFCKAGFVLAVAADLARKPEGEYELVEGISVKVARGT